MKANLQPDADTGNPKLSVIETVPRLGAKRDVANLANMKSIRWVDLQMSAGMPHLKLGARRCRFDLAEVAAWLKQKYGVAA
jgi:hypothetical protein